MHLFRAKNIFYAGPTAERKTFRYRSIKQNKKVLLPAQ